MIKDPVTKTLHSYSILHFFHSSEHCVFVPRIPRIDSLGQCEVRILQRQWYPNSSPTSQWLLNLSNPTNNTSKWNRVQTCLNLICRMATFHLILSFYFVVVGGRVGWLWGWRGGLDDAKRSEQHTRIEHCQCLRDDNWAHLWFSPPLPCPFVWSLRLGCHKYGPIAKRQGRPFKEQRTWPAGQLINTLCDPSCLMSPDINTLHSTIAIP